MNDDTISTTPQPQASAPNLALADLVAVVNLIQIVSQRGAIRPEEMAVVGPLYDKLIGFLKSTGALTPPPAAPETPDQQGESE
jgi:hypothetical protein